jgi:hypothetical protein
MSAHQAPRHRVDRPHWGPLTVHERANRPRVGDWWFWLLLVVLAAAAGVFLGVVL